MKYFIKVIFLLLAIKLFTNCSGKVFPTGNFQDKQVVVDGDLDEWDKPIRFVSSGGQILYNITNDNENIYIGLETHDEATAFKILRSGINIYIDPAGGQNKEICLAFPVAATSVNTLKENTGNGALKTDRNELRETLLVQATSFRASGFKNMENRLYDLSDKSKLKVAIKNGANNSLGYEAEIPLQYIFGTTAFSKNSGHNMSVGIIINAIRGAGNYSNGSGAAASGRHGGGRGGGRGGGGNYRRNAASSENPATQTPDHSLLYKQDTNWYPFKLAVKK